RRKLLTYLSNKKVLNKNLECLLKSDLAFLKIRKIKSVHPSTDFLYDLSMQDENFVGGFGGICLHNTMLATATALQLHGAKPVFVDVERDTLCIDFEDFKRKSGMAKALMLVSINGRYPSHVDEIIEYCKDKNIIIIEDAAQSLGSFHNGKHVGTLGDVGSFSFSMPKIITMGGGGCLITNNKEIYDQIQMIKNFGRRKGGGHDHEIMGFNFKFNDLQATIGIEQMKKLGKRATRKKEMYWFYEHYLRDVKGIQLIDTNLKETTPW
ncbi:unnamed protein product, partial [marine sediment metagenome]